MGVNYLNPADQLTAAKWNELISAVDAKMVAFYNGLSLFMGAGSYLSNRIYWMFDPATPAWNLHPFAPAAMSAFGAKQYNHAALLAYVAGLPVDTVGTGDAQSDDFHVIRLNNNSNPPPTNLLDNANQHVVSSLSVLTRMVNGSPYNIAVWGTELDTQANGLTWILNGAVEIPQPLEMIEVCVIGGPFNWDATWNKFGMIRVHNFGNTVCVASFPGGLVVDIPAGAQRCVRQTNGTYSAQNVYLHPMQPGDGRYFDQSRFTSSNTPNIINCSVTCPAAIGQYTAPLMAYISPGLISFPRTLDSTLMWDVTSAPASPFMSSIELPIFDMLTYTGMISGTSGAAQVSAQFTGFNNLQTMFQGIGVTYTYNPATFNWTLNGAFNLSDITTNLIQSLGGVGHFVAGSSVNGSSGSLSTQMQFVRTRRLVAGSVYITQYTYSSYTTDSNGNYVVGSNLTANVTNQSNAQGDASENTGLVSWRVADTAASVATQIAGANCSFISVGNFQLTNTAFGPYLSWTETYPLSKHTSDQLFQQFASTNPDSFVSCDGFNFTIKRCIALGSGFPTNQFPKLTLGMRMLPWHYPRVVRKYSAQRSLSFSADSCPWQIIASLNPLIIENAIGLASATVLSV